MGTELNSKVVCSDEPPNSGGQMDMKHDESSLEFPQIGLIPVSCSVFSPEA